VIHISDEVPTVGNLDVKSVHIKDAGGESGSRGGGLPASDTSGGNAGKGNKKKQKNNTMTHDALGGKSWLIER
jgi:hypothetical protein